MTQLEILHHKEDGISEDKCFVVAGFNYPRKKEVLLEYLPKSTTDTISGSETIATLTVIICFVFSYFKKELPENYLFKWRVLPPRADDDGDDEDEDDEDYY